MNIVQFICSLVNVCIVSSVWFLKMLLWMFSYVCPWQCAQVSLGHITCGGISGSESLYNLTLLDNARVFHFQLFLPHIWLLVLWFLFLFSFSNFSQKVLISSCESGLEYHFSPSVVSRRDVVSVGGLKEAVFLVVMCPMSLVDDWQGNENRIEKIEKRCSRMRHQWNWGCAKVHLTEG